MGRGGAAAGGSRVAAPRSCQRAENSARAARTGFCCARARRPPPAAGATPRPAPPSGSWRPFLPCSSVAAWTGDREPGQGRAGAAGRAPEVGAEREAGRPGGGEAGRTSAWVCPADGPRIKMRRGRPGFEARLPACLSLGRSCPHSDTPPRPPPSPLGHSAPPTTCGHLTPLALCRLRTCPLGPVLPFSLQTGLPPSLTSSGPSSTKLDSVLWPSPSLFVVLYTCHFNSVHPLHHHAS